MSKICNICKKPIKKNQWPTIDQRWLDAGNYGPIPDFAIVHVTCDYNVNEKFFGEKILKGGDKKC